MAPGTPIKNLKDKIFLADTDSFEALALEIFQYQASANPVYHDYLKLLGIEPNNITRLKDVPFMPIEFFRTSKVLIHDMEPVIQFESSGTTGSKTSVHFLPDAQIYQDSIQIGFERVFGNPSDWTFICLLPGYSERPNSSLIYMMNYLMSLSASEHNGFYLYEHMYLAKKLEEIKGKVMLVGVSFALLDFCEKYPVKLKQEGIIMETGGMKGRRKEIIREELHDRLKKAFGMPAIASEYGMTELLSQAYALESGRFKTPPWMRVMIREANDPFTYVEDGQTGGVNVIDLANLYTCSFIATQDLGRKLNEEEFEVSGRFDLADARGCSLMVA